MPARKPTLETIPGRFHPARLSAPCISRNLSTAAGFHVKRNGLTTKGARLYWGKGTPKMNLIPKWVRISDMPARSFLSHLRPQAVSDVKNM